MNDMSPFICRHKQFRAACHFDRIHKAGLFPVQLDRVPVSVFDPDQPAAVLFKHRPGPILFPNRILASDTVLRKNEMILIVPCESTGPIRCEYGQCAGRVAITDRSAGIHFQILAIWERPLLPEWAIFHRGLRVVSSLNRKRLSYVCLGIIRYLQEKVACIEVHRLKSQGTVLVSPQQLLVQRWPSRRLQHVVCKQVRSSIQSAAGLFVRKIDQLVVDRCLSGRLDHYTGCLRLLAFPLQIPHIGRLSRLLKRLLCGYSIGRVLRIC